MIRKRTKLIGGFLFTSQGNGRWVSEPYEIARDDDNLTFCDTPHPVKRKGEPGYLCGGNEQHNYTTWHVWDLSKDDYLTGNLSECESFAEACEGFADWVRARRDVFLAAVLGEATK